MAGIGTILRSRRKSAAGRLIGAAVVLGILSWVSIVLYTCGAETDRSGDAIEGVCVKVLDGDSIDVKLSNSKKITVRLFGIDCPEGDQPFGSKAKKITMLKTLKKHVFVTPLDKDKFGRVVGLVRIAGDKTTLNEHLIREGAAWVFDWFCKEPFCDEWRQMQKETVREKRGLWKDKNPAPPWKWRKRH